MTAITPTQPIANFELIEAIQTAFLAAHGLADDCVGFEMRVVPGFQGALIEGTSARVDPIPSAVSVLVKVTRFENGRSVVIALAAGRGATADEAVIALAREVVKVTTRQANARNALMALLHVPVEPA